MKHPMPEQAAPTLLEKGRPITSEQALGGKRLAGDRRATSHRLLQIEFEGHVVGKVHLGTPGVGLQLPVGHPLSGEQLHIGAKLRQEILLPQVGVGQNHQAPGIPMPFTHHADQGSLGMDECSPSPNAPSPPHRTTLPRGSNRRSSISLGILEGGGHRIKLPNDGPSFAEPDSEMALNEWIDLIIEYKKGTIRITVNGVGKTYEHEKVTIENPKAQNGQRFTFKGGEDCRILFDSVRLWDCGE